MVGQELNISKWVIAYIRSGVAIYGLTWTDDEVKLLAQDVEDAIHDKPENTLRTLRSLTAWLRLHSFPEGLAYLERLS